MSYVEEKLLEISRSNRVSMNEMDYFEDHVENYPNQWGMLYLWSIESRNYTLSDCILSCGYDLNIDVRVRIEVINSFEFFKRDYVKKIIKDGFIIDSKIISQIQQKNNSDMFDSELLKEVFFEERRKKIDKIKFRIACKSGLN